MMMDDHLDQPWFWGDVSMELIEAQMSGSEPGTFLVFNDGSKDSLKLAVRHSRRTEYTRIYMRDHVYGLAEPLGFETLEAVLEAINTSPHTGNCMLYPAVRGSNDAVDSNGVDDDDREVDILDCLTKIRAWHRLLLQTADQRDEQLVTIEALDGEIKDCSVTSDGLHMVLTMLETHQDKQQQLKRRMSFKQVADLQAFDENERVLLRKQSDIRLRKQAADDRVDELQKEKAAQCKTYVKHVTTINDLGTHIRHRRRMLEDHSKNFEEFLDGLLYEHSSELLAVIEVKSSTKSQSEKMLQKKPDGSFLVRESRKLDSVPFVVSVRFQNQVEHFPVVSRDGRLGFDETTCIFDNIRDLVDTYTRVSFRVHHVKYGELRLRHHVTH